MNTIIISGRLIAPFELMPKDSKGKEWGKAKVAVWHSKEATSFFEIRQTFYSDNSKKFFLGLEKGQDVTVQGDYFNYGIRDKQTNKTVYTQYIEVHKLEKPYVKKVDGTGQVANPNFSRRPSEQPEAEPDDIPFG